MTIAIDPREEREYVPRDDRRLPANLRTCFLYRDLTEHERVDIADASFASLDDELDGTIVRSTRGSQTIKTLRCALIGTKSGMPLRVQREDGEPGELIDVPFERDGSGRVSPSYLRRIPWHVQVELAEEILTRATIDAVAVGKHALSRTFAGTRISPSVPASAGASAEGTMSGPDPTGAAKTAAPATPSEPAGDAP